MSVSPPSPDSNPASAPEAVPQGRAPEPGHRAGPAEGVRVPRTLLYLLCGVAALALVLSGLLWQRLGTIQEQLARQSAESSAHAIEARALARQAHELARDTAARQAVADSRLSEVTLQRAQLEELIQSLSRSRDENLVVDIEAALRLAQQQAQLTLSAEPLLAALRTAEQRLARANQPGLARVRAVVARDIERITGSNVADVPALLARLDELTRLADDLPVANAVGPGTAAAARRDAPAPAPAHWWARAVAVVKEEARGLVRVSRIEQPEAALLSPEQSFFLRENLKLKLLNARLSLLARQTEQARVDVGAAASALYKYFDPAARRTQAAAALLQQVQAQLKNVAIPRIDETLAVLDATAAAR